MALSPTSGPVPGGGAEDTHRAALAVLASLVPTIFAIGVKGFGRLTEEGSGLLIMAIAGGALVVVQGWLADSALRREPTGAQLQVKLEA